MFLSDLLDLNTANARKDFTCFHFRTYRNGENQYTLLGIVSGGIACASEEFPDFYTFIAQEEVAI